MQYLHSTRFISIHNWTITGVRYRIAQRRCLPPRRYNIQKWVHLRSGAFSENVAANGGEILTRCFLYTRFFRLLQRRLRWGFFGSAHARQILAGTSVSFSQFKITWLPFTHGVDLLTPARTWHVCPFDIS